MLRDRVIFQGDRNAIRGELSPLTTETDLCANIRRNCDETAALCKSTGELVCKGLSYGDGYSDVYAPPQGEGGNSCLFRKTVASAKCC